MARKDPPHLIVKEKWRRKAQDLPPGGKLLFEAYPDHIWLHIIQLPPGARGGAGTKLMSELLAVADQAGMTVSLTADPTDEISDPGVYDLVKWYSRFGFSLYALDNDRVALMERKPGSRHSTPSSVLEKYRSTPPVMTREEFEVWEADQLRRLDLQVDQDERPALRVPGCGR